MANIWYGNSALLFKLTRNVLPLRFGHTLRGKPPGIAKSLAQKLSVDENCADSVVNRPVDIGLPFAKPSRSKELKKRLQYVREQRKSIILQTSSREQKLQIDLNDMKKDWLETVGPHQICRIAHHYGIYKHLFDNAFFKPRINLNINFEMEEATHPVFYGNILTPSETRVQPSVRYSLDNNEADNFSWTLLLTNPDGNFEDSNKEMVHWFISNIPGSDVSKGEILVPYLQPVPPKGVGYQRHVFLLFKQDKLLDFSQFKINDRYKLEQRNFSTLDFYRQFQDVITPAGLAFFQSSWDPSLTEFYHNVLDRKEPIYEYDFPAPYIKEQKWFPLKEPFNLYMDKFRDTKQVNKEYLMKKLAKTHPFKGPQPELQFPNAHAIDKKIPSWRATEIRKDRLRWGRINDY